MAICMASMPIGAVEGEAIPPSGIDLDPLTSAPCGMVTGDAARPLLLILGDLAAKWLPRIDSVARL